MTLEEFLQDLKQSQKHFQWWLDYNELRTREETREGAYCPITAVCKMKTGVHYTTGDFDIAGQQLGLNEETIYDIMCGADGDNGHEDIRRKLLAALDFLDEEPTKQAVA